jgi:hypothetical protein
MGVEIDLQIEALISKYISENTEKFLDVCYALACLHTGSYREANRIIKKLDKECLQILEYLIEFEEDERKYKEMKRAVRIQKV